MSDYEYKGQVSTSSLLEWLLIPDRNLSPGPGKKKDRSEEQLHASFHENLKKHEAEIRRSRLQAKHKRAKRAKSFRNKRPGTTSPDAGTSSIGGTRKTAGGFVLDATRPSIGTEKVGYWLASRICSHCHALGLRSRGSWGECPACRLFTDLRL